MGIAKQIGLLLKQNLIERRRRWGITLLELGWPVVLLIIIVSMRSFYPITNIKDCKYEPRAMPSSGVFPFVQSYACNLDAKPKCMDGDKATTAKLKERTTALKQVEDVLYENRPLFSALNAGLVQTMPALEQLSVVFTENPEIQEFLNVTDDLLAKNLFKDANLLREELIDTYGLDAELVDTIMNSNINLTKGIELLQGITSELCDVNNTSTPLTDYLILPFNSTSSLADINREICNLGEEQIASLVDLLQEQLDSSAVFSLVKRLMSLFTPNVSDLLSDLEHMVDVVRSLSSFKGLTEQLPSLQKALEFATELLSFARKAAQQLPISPDQISNILEQLDPLITSWSKQSPVWEDIKRAIYYLTTGMDWLANTLDSLPELLSVLQPCGPRWRVSESRASVCAQSMLFIRELLGFIIYLINASAVPNINTC
ncbi:phospholipid-transporting ATPase ABCA1-like [Watersipora subatra]|uniref:phospholipid-transporting ATPase ABCA1-like n=1 Tax=Watersipora subatra TaxID=2589382 RepID=UPI00355C2CEF